MNLDVISQFAPVDDPRVECEVRLWQHNSVHVFLHPQYRKTIGFFDGIPLIIKLDGVTFHCTVFFGGEFFAIGPADIKPSAFNLPEGADYIADANVNWDIAVPDVVKQSLRESPGMLRVWRWQSIEVIRGQLNRIARARKPSTRLQRELDLIAELGGAARRQSWF